MTRTDWMPTSRQEILNMAIKWTNMLTEKGKKWNIPDETMIAFDDLCLDAQSALTHANTMERTKSLTASVNEAFKKLNAAMRDLKKRYFYIPPLTTVDLASLDLSAPDEIRSDIPIPMDTAKGSTLLTVRFNLTVTWDIITTAASDPRANHGVRINYGVQVDDPAAQTALTGKHYYLSGPAHSQEQLAADVFTRRKKLPIEFPAEDSGKTAWFALRIENSKGDKGPWGELFSAVIP